MIASSIIYSFPEEFSKEFLLGMEKENCNFSDIKFLEILKKEKAKASILLFFQDLMTQKNIHSLIAQKLCYRIETLGEGKEEISAFHTTAKIRYLIKNSVNQTLAGTYFFEEHSEFAFHNMILGLAHGMLGMKKGEKRTIFIHPDFAYVRSASFANGDLLQATVELIDVGPLSSTWQFPSLQPHGALAYSKTIHSCEEYSILQEQFFEYCGFMTWSHYKKASPFVNLEELRHLLNAEKSSVPRTINQEENCILLKLNWLLYRE